MRCLSRRVRGQFRGKICGMPNVRSWPTGTPLEGQLTICSKLRAKKAAADTQSPSRNLLISFDCLAAFAAGARARSAPACCGICGAAALCRLSPPGHDSARCSGPLAHGFAQVLSTAGRSSSLSRSNRNSFHLIERDLVARSIVELRGARALVRRHGLAPKLMPHDAPRVSSPHR
jgi:hypothetical protein